MKTNWWIGVGVGLILAGWLSALWPVAKAGSAGPTQVRWRTRVVDKVVTRWRTRQIVTFNLPSGLSADDVASYLYQTGVIKDQQEFLNRAGDAATRFQVGIYHFTPGESEDRLIATLTQVGG